MLSTAEWLTLLGAALTAGLSAGGTIMWARLQIRRALRMAHRAHLRLDELEEQTGTHTQLREHPSLAETGGPDRR